MGNEKPPPAAVAFEIRKEGSLLHHCNAQFLLSNDGMLLRSINYRSEDPE